MGFKWHFFLIYYSQKCNVHVDALLNMLSSFPHCVQGVHYMALVKGCVSMPEQVLAASSLYYVRVAKTYIYLCN